MSEPSEQPEPGAVSEPSEEPEPGGVEPTEAPPGEAKPAAAPTAESAPATESEPTELEVHASRVAGLLRSLVPDITAEPARQYVRVVVPVDSLEAAALALRDNLGYALLSMVTAVDYPDRLEVVYLAFALEHPYGVEIRAALPHEELPDCPSLTSVWPGADFQEREVYDLMGINFVGHPDLRRILTEDDFPGHPLRKDFSIDPDYVLMRHLRYGVEGQFRPEAERGSAPHDPHGNGVEPGGPTA